MKILTTCFVCGELTEEGYKVPTVNGKVVGMDYPRDSVSWQDHGLFRPVCKTCHDKHKKQAPPRGPLGVALIDGAGI